MVKSWQKVQGNYPPANTFIRDNAFQVLTRNVKQVDNDLWEWEEYHMPIDIYEATIASITNESSLPTENQSGLFDLAALVDENSQAIMELASIIS